MARTASPPAGGRLVAWTGFLFGSITSIAANVLHAWLPAAHQPPGWTPGLAPQIGAAVWPIGLMIAVEALTRIRWPARPRLGLARYGGAGTVALGSATISYGHLRTSSKPGSTAAWRPQSDPWCSTDSWSSAAFRPPRQQPHHPRRHPTPGAPSTRHGLVEPRRRPRSQTPARHPKSAVPGGGGAPVLATSPDLAGDGRLLLIGPWSVLSAQGMVSGTA